MSYDLTEILADAREQVARERVEREERAAREAESISGLLFTMMDLRRQLAPLSDAVCTGERVDGYVVECHCPDVDHIAEERQMRHIREIRRRERAAR